VKNKLLVYANKLFDLTCLDLMKYKSDFHHKILLFKISGLQQSVETAGHNNYVTVILLLCSVPFATFFFV